MADFSKVIGPEVVQAATGFPVPNQGGMARQPVAPQRTNLLSPPAARGGPPGPMPAAQPADPMAGMLPITRAVLALMGQGGGQGKAAPAAPAAPTPAAAPIADASAQPQPSVEPSPALDMPDTSSPWQPAGKLGYIPRQWELDALPEGHVLETPVGQIHRDLDGQLHVTLNEAGQQAWHQAVAKDLADYGWHPGYDDPLAPQPQLVPGQPNFNPYIGQWRNI